MKKIITILMICLLACSAFAVSPAQVKAAFESFMTDPNAVCLKIVDTSYDEPSTIFIRVGSLGYVEMDDECIDVEELDSYIWVDQITNIVYSRATGVLSIDYYGEDYDYYEGYDYYY